jgi:hypothetical protein
MSPSTPTDLGGGPDSTGPVYYDPGAATSSSEDPVSDSSGFESVVENPEERGVARAQWAALCSLIGLALALLGPFVFIVISGFALPIFGSRFGSTALTIGAIELLVGLVVAGSVLQVVSFGLYTSAFGLLRRVDLRFRVPRILTIVGLVGFVMILLGTGLILGFIFQAVSCAASGAASSCLDPSLLLGASGLILLGSILGLVGWIGLLVGIFRAGSRYESSLLKVGAILMIIPLVNIVAPVLIFVAFRGIPARFDLRAGEPPA